jgi:antitoxin component YwqK of YwqJK toxin-antitoxin module
LTVQPEQPSQTTRISFDDIDWTDDQRVTFRDKPVTGEVVELDPDGRPIEVVTYSHGIREGLTRSFYPNGTVESKRWYESRIPEGMARTWYENGQLRSETRFQRGRAVEKQMWAEDGTNLTGRRAEAGS